MEALAHETAKTFFAQGFAYPYPVLSETEATQAYQDLQEYEQQLGQFSCSSSSPSCDDRMKIHLLAPWAWKLVHHPAVVALACACLQTSDVWCWSTDLNIKQPLSGTHYTWHQDSTYAGIDPPAAAITVWLALTPSLPETGCLRCIPKSSNDDDPSYWLPQYPHDVGRGGPNNALSLGQEIVDLEKHGLDVTTAQDVILQPGQASVHSFLTVHASMPHISSIHPRRVGFAMRFVSAHAKRPYDIIQEMATLISGSGHDMFIPEIEPVHLLGIPERQQHRNAMERERTNYFSGVQRKQSSKLTMMTTTTTTTSMTMDDSNGGTNTNPFDQYR